MAGAGVPEPGAQVTEQHIVDTLYKIMSQSLPLARAGMKDLFKAHEKDTMAIRVVRTYLYDPNSPMRNEDLYLPFVEGLAESAFTPDSLRESYRREVRMCSMNKAGEKVHDFVFRTLQGKNIRLYEVPGDFTMLFFSNPGCTACKEIIDQVNYLQPIVEAINSGKLSVVNVYIDEDLKAWRDYAVHYPASWYSGYDPEFIIRKDEIFNVRAIPSLYLLDAEKRVVMKDAPTDRVLIYLMNYFQ